MNLLMLLSLLSFMKNNEALGTWLAGVATAASIWFLVWQYRKDQNKLFLREEQDQAAQIAIYRTKIAEVDALVISNSSSLPIYMGTPYVSYWGSMVKQPLTESSAKNVLFPLAITADDSVIFRTVIIPPGKIYFPLIGSGWSEMLIGGFNDGPLNNEEVEHVRAITKAKYPVFLFGLYFQDARGISWNRTHDGRLQKESYDEVAHLLTKETLSFIPAT